MTRAIDEPMIAELQEPTRTAWNDIAEGYDEFITPTHMWLGNEALIRVRLRADMRFLDVAAGSGALSIPAARLGAQVLATTFLRSCWSGSRSALIAKGFQMLKHA